MAEEQFTEPVPPAVQGAVSDAVSQVGGGVVSGAVAAAGSGPPGVDPELGGLPPEILAALQATQGGEKVEDPDKPRAERIYYEVWGRLPPEGWWKGVQHLSDFEIYEQMLEGGKGVRRTQYWRDKGAYYAQVISQAMGRRTG